MLCIFFYLWCDFCDFSTLFGFCLFQVYFFPNYFFYWWSGYCDVPNLFLVLFVSPSRIKAFLSLIFVLSFFLLVIWLLWSITFCFVLFISVRCFFLFYEAIEIKTNLFVNFLVLLTFFCINNLFWKIQKVGKMRTNYRLITYKIYTYLKKKIIISLIYRNLHFQWIQTMIKWIKYNFQIFWKNDHVA